MENMLHLCLHSALVVPLWEGNEHHVLITVIKKKKNPVSKKIAERPVLILLLGRLEICGTRIVSILYEGL